MLVHFSRRIHCSSKPVMPHSTFCRNAPFFKMSPQKSPLPWITMYTQFQNFGSLQVPPVLNWEANTGASNILKPSPALHVGGPNYHISFLATVSFQLFQRCCLLHETWWHLPFPQVLCHGPYPSTLTGCLTSRIPCRSCWSPQEKISLVGTSTVWNMNTVKVRTTR